jgi:hypothetical protein
MNALKRYRSNKVYRAKQNLLEHIHTACEFQLNKLRKACDILDKSTSRMLDNIHKSHDSLADYCKYGKPYRIAPLEADINLAYENSPEFACIETCAKLVDNTTKDNFVSEFVD